VQASPPTSDGLSGELFSPASSYGAMLSGALGVGSGLSLGVADGLGEGEAITGNAFAITLRIFAMVASFKYAGYALGAKR